MQLATPHFNIGLIARTLACIVAGVLAVLLVACGGGSTYFSFSSGGPIQSPPLLPPAGTGVTVDAAAAWRHYLGSAQRWQVTGRQNGNVFSFSVALAPGPPRVFPYNGTVALTTSETWRLRLAGAANADTEGVLYYNGDSLVGIVGTSAGSAPCAVIRTPFISLPARARVGDAGTIVSLDRLDACTPSATRIGSTILTWAVEQDLAVTLFCVGSVRQDVAGVPEGAQTACVRSNAAGELGDGARLSIRRADGTLITGKNY